MVGETPTPIALVLQIIAAICVVGVIVAILGARRAPLAHEDDEGFHLGGQDYVPVRVRARRAGVRKKRRQGRG